MRNGKGLKNKFPEWALQVLTEKAVIKYYESEDGPVGLRMNFTRRAPYTLQQELGILHTKKCNVSWRGNINFLNRR